MSEYSGNSKTIDFGSIYNNKPACSYLGTHDRIILFDSILNIEEAKALHEWLGTVLKLESE